MGWVINATPRSLCPGKRPGTHFIGEGVDLWDGKDVCGKPRPHRIQIPGPSSPQRVATPTTLSWLTIITIIMIILIIILSVYGTLPWHIAWDILLKPSFLHCTPLFVLVICSNSLRLVGPGIEFQWGWDFSHPSRPAKRPTQPPIKWMPVNRLGRGVNHPPTYSAEVKESVELKLYFLSELSWRLLGRILPLPIYTSLYPLRMLYE